MILAAVSIVIMIALVFRRLRIQKRQAWWNTRKQVLTPAVFAFLDGTPFDAPLRLSLGKSDIRPLQEIAHDLISSVRGDARDKLITLLVEVGGVADNTRRLQSAREWERLQAVRNLSLYPKENVEAVLRKSLDDASNHVSIAAAKALIDMDVEISVRELTEKFFSGGGAKSLALREIFRRIAPNQTTALRRMLSEQTTEPVKLLSIDALGTVRDYSSIPAIMEQCASPSINVRAEAMRALATIGHPDAMPTILTGLDDGAWEVRAQAAVGAGRVGIDAAIPQLSGLLDDQEWWVRFRAAEALKKIGGKGQKLLTSAAKGPSRAARVAGLVLSQDGG